MLKTLFQETIIELQLKKPFFEDVVLCNFLQILAVIARYHQQILSPLGNDFSIDRLIMRLINGIKITGMLHQWQNIAS